VPNDDQDSRPSRPRLTLVPPLPREDDADHRLDTAPMSEFGYGGFKGALERADWILTEQLRIRGYPASAVEGKTEQAIRLMVWVLSERRSVLRARQISEERLQFYHEVIGLNLDMIPHMRRSGDPDLPRRNIVRNLTAFMAEMVGLVNAGGRVVNRDELEKFLVPYGVTITDPDVTRLLAHFHNQDRLCPSILVIPNMAGFENPFFALIEGDLALPAHLASFLRLFSH